MNKVKAIDILSYHSGSNNHTNNPKWVNGFLGSLRPYQGTLIDNNFHEVMECLKVLSNYLRKNSEINKKLVSQILGIIHLARSWGVNKDGMLKRNNLIKEKDAKVLEQWIDIISCTFTYLLDGCDDEVSFEAYQEYCNRKVDLPTKFNTE